TRRKRDDTQNKSRRYHRIAGLCLLLGGSLLAASAMDSSARAAAAPAAAPAVAPTVAPAVAPTVAPAVAPTVAPAVASAAAPPHLDFDLDAFDASKKLMVLPDGESLAYIDRGERSGTPVVLIHGYTDNARDWVPM